MNEVKTPKKPLVFYYGIAMVVLLLLNMLVMPLITQHQVEEVDYGTFIKMTENKEIGQVEIEDNQILFTNKDKSKIYKTGLLNDDGLVQRLYDSGAEFSGEIVEQMSPLMSFIPAAGGRHLHQRHGDPADIAAGEYSVLGAAADHLHWTGADTVPQSHEENGRPERHEVRHGQEQCEGVCAVFGRH